MGQSGATLNEIIVSTQHLTGLIGDIASASRQQSAGVAEVNGAIAQMEGLTQSNAAQTEEITATSDALADQAEHLRELVSHFKLTTGSVERSGNPGKRDAIELRAPALAGMHRLR